MEPDRWWTVSLGGIAYFFVGEDPASTGIYDLAAGSLNFSGGWVRFGDAAGSTGLLNQTGGTMTVAANVAFLVGEDGAGTYNLSAGTGTFHVGLVLANDAGSSGTLNLTGTGILQVGGTNGIAQGAGTATVNLGGGTVQVIDSNLTTSVNATLVAATQSTIDTNNLGATFSGILSGSGSLAKAGAGTLLLSGANGYSGGTTINGGTIQAGSASALGGANGSLLINNGTFDLNGFNTSVGALNGTANATITNNAGPGSRLTIGAGNGGGTYAGVLADGDGTLGLDKSGTGTEILTGANTYTGGTQVLQGTLTAGSASAFGQGSLTNNGTVNAGNGNHAINVHGDYFQLGGAALILTINSAALHDDMAVTGTASLGGKLQLNLAPGFIPASKSSIDLIQSAGLNGTTFSSLDLVLPGFEKGALVYTATDVSVVFSRVFLGQAGNLTPNQAAVAGYFNQFAPVVTTEILASWSPISLR
ncbi:MAG: autotransporter-associated beta strand repeat-containing protein [Verrucomicrobiota bacterium]